MNAMRLIDWNFQVIPSLTGSLQDFKISLAVIQDCFSRFGVSKFFLLAPYDFRDPVVLHHAKRLAYEKNLSKLLLRPLSLQSASCIPLQEGISRIDDLSLLCHKKSGYLPLQLPIAAYDDWMDAELNRLLYQRRQKILFLSFELALILYPPNALEKLLRIPNAVYQFGYKSLVEERIQSIIKSLLRNGKTVLLGTSFHTCKKLPDYDIQSILLDARPFFSKEEWDLLFRRSRLFWSSNDTKL